MTILKIILITVGVAFTTFGYEIYFQKKYNLINGFEEDYKNRIICPKSGSNRICIGNWISGNWNLRSSSQVDKS